MTKEPDSKQKVPLLDVMDEFFMLDHGSQPKQPSVEVAAAAAAHVCDGEREQGGAAAMPPPYTPLVGRGVLP